MPRDHVLQCSNSHLICPDCFDDLKPGKITAAGKKAPANEPATPAEGNTAKKICPSCAVPYDDPPMRNR